MKNQYPKDPYPGEKEDKSYEKPSTNPFPNYENRVYENRGFHPVMNDPY